MNNMKLVRITSWVHPDPTHNQAPYIRLVDPIDGGVYKQYSPITTSRKTAVLALLGRAVFTYGFQAAEIDIDPDLLELLND